jgi:hypothetical protein
VSKVDFTNAGRRRSEGGGGIGYIDEPEVDYDFHTMSSASIFKFGIRTGKSVRDK